jgi:hypothetical protein
LALQLRKKHGKPSVRIVEKCPDIPVAVFTNMALEYTDFRTDTAISTPTLNSAIHKVTTRAERVAGLVVLDL